MSPEVERQDNHKLNGGKRRRRARRLRTRRGTLTNQFGGSYARFDVDVLDVGAPGRCRPVSTVGRDAAVAHAIGSTMKQTLARIGRIALGVALLVLGVIGLFLPFLQGILFIVVGLTLLSRESERVRRWVDWLRDVAERKGFKALGRAWNGRE